MTPLDARMRSQRMIRLFPRFRFEIFSQVFKAGVLRYERQLHRSGRAVALLLDDQLSMSAIRFRRLDQFLAEQKGHQVGILFNLAAFSQVGEARLAATLFGSAVELRYRDDWDPQFLRKAFQPARDS